MITKSNIAVLILLMAISSVCSSQNIYQILGDFKSLKGEKTLNIEYSYDGLFVGEITEEEYIAEKVTTYNYEETGKGEKWKEAWKNDRKNRYQPKFEELFNRYLEDMQITAREGANDAKYTVRIKTIMIEPGYNIGVSRRSAFLDFEIDIFETKNPENIISKTAFSSVPGHGPNYWDLDSGQRISEAYAKLGKSFAKYIIKSFK